MNKRKEEFLKGKNDVQLTKTENKIELLKCNLDRLKCTEHLAEINNNYSKASYFQCEKDYSKSIQLLKTAYYKASELNRESTCTHCVSLFQTTIGQSLKNLNSELHKMTHGFFKKEKLKPCYIESCSALQEIKNLR